MTYARRSARVLLADGNDRLLLMCARWDVRRPELGSGWFTPGGGVGDGEPLAEAAARELAEETGLVVSPADLGEVVAYAEGQADLAWVSGRIRDDFFFHRVETHDVSTDGFEEFERSHALGHRWWTLDEVAATDETVIPYGLVPLARDLLAGRRPPVPVRLPWHH